MKLAEANILRLWGTWCGRRNSRQLSGPHIKMLFQIGDVLREDSRDDHSCEAFLPRFLSNECTKEALIFSHVWRVPRLQEEDRQQGCQHRAPDWLFQIRITLVFLCALTYSCFSNSPSCFWWSRCKHLLCLTLSSQSPLLTEPARGHQRSRLL